MARKKTLYFQGSACKTDCSGHQAGYAYALAGGTRPARGSTSFNNGMRIAQGLKPIKPRKKRK